MNAKKLPIQLTYLSQVGKRKLVRIQKTKTKNQMLTFQIMSEQDLEIATRKAKAIPGTYLGSKSLYGEKYLSEESTQNILSRG